MVVNQGGLAPGGLNFDAKLRRESTDIEDLFIAHISGMDTWARALRGVAHLKADGTHTLHEPSEERKEGRRGTKRREERGD